MKVFFLFVINFSFFFNSNVCNQQNKIEHIRTKVNCISKDDNSALKYNFEISFELRSIDKSVLQNDLFLKIVPDNSGQKLFYLKLVLFGPIRKKEGYFTGVFQISDPILEKFIEESGHPCDEECNYEGANRIINSAIIIRENSGEIKVWHSRDFKGVFRSI